MNIRWAHRNVLGFGIGLPQDSSLFTPVISVSLTQLNGLQTFVECFVRTKKSNSFWPPNLSWIGVSMFQIPLRHICTHDLGEVCTRSPHLSGL